MKRAGGPDQTSLAAMDLLTTEIVAITEPVPVLPHRKITHVVPAHK